LTEPKKKKFTCRAVRRKWGVKENEGLKKSRLGGVD